MSVESDKPPVVESSQEESNAFRSYLVRKYMRCLCSMYVGRLIEGQRIFRYGSNKEYALQLMGMACALGSGVGMAMVNLVFGEFITLIIHYASGDSTPEAFRSRSGILGYVGASDPTRCLPGGLPELISSTVLHSSSLELGDFSSPTRTARSSPSPRIESPGTSVTYT